MKRFEYHRETLNVYPGSGFLNTLNEQGMKGWELVTVIQEGKQAMIIMKRELKEQ